MRTLLVTLACGLPVVWLAATATLGSASSSRQPRPPTEEPSTPTPTEMLAAELQGQAERLRERLANAPAPRVPLRDPFQYRAPESPAAPGPRAFAVAEAFRRGDAVPARPAVASLRLVGVAEDTVDGALVRRAILSGLGDLFIVGVGDSVAGRYMVRAIGADAVELDDLQSGEVVTLGLR